MTIVSLMLAMTGVVFIYRGTCEMLAEYKIGMKVTVVKGLLTLVANQVFVIKFFVPKKISWANGVYDHESYVNIIQSLLIGPEALVMALLMRRFFPAQELSFIYAKTMDVKTNRPRASTPSDAPVFSELVRIRNLGRKHEFMSIHKDIVRKQTTVMEDVSGCVQLQGIQSDSYKSLHEGKAAHAPAVLKMESLREEEEHVESE